MVGIVFKMLDSRSQILHASDKQRELQQAGWDDWTKHREQAHTPHTPQPEPTTLDCRWTGHRDAGGWSI